MLLRQHFEKKTGREIKILFGKSSICKNEKVIFVSDNKIQAEGLGDFSNNLGKRSDTACKTLAKNVLKNPGRSMDITAKLSNAPASRNPKAALSTLPELITFFNTGKDLYPGQCV